MTREKPTSFWTEAALRVQHQSIHATLAEQERASAAAEDRTAAAGEAAAPQAPADAGVRKSVRREPPAPPQALVPTEDALDLRLAEELEYVRRMVEALGDSLSGDPALVRRHMVALQSIDVAGQILGHVANVIRSSDSAGAVERIGMCELKARLKRNRIY